MIKLKLFFIFLCFLFIAGCNEEEQIQAWLDEAAKLKIDAQDKMNQTPYRKEQFQSFKTYFSKINQIPLNLKDNEKFQKPFNQFLARKNIDEQCQKVFIQKADWVFMMERCTKNRFFLCAEEVRSYPAMIEAIKGFLDSNNQKRFLDSASCQDLP